MHSIELPEVLAIGPFDYQVKTDTEKLVENQIGECDRKHLTITVDLDMAPMRVADTYLHEILHALWDSASLGDEADEESVVSAMSTGFLDFMRRNPQGLDPVWEAIATLRRSDLADKMKSRGTFG